MRVDAGSPRMAFALVLVITLGGCSAYRDRRTAREVIQAYDRAVIETHLTGSHEALDKVTTQDESDRVQVIAMGLRARKETLLASLEQLAVRRAHLDDAKAAGTALAEERWSYQRVNLETRAPTTPPIKRTYTLEYDLRRRGQRWVVDRVRFLRSDGPPAHRSP